MCVRRRAAGAEHFQFRSHEEDNMMLLLYSDGLHYNQSAIVPARRPIAGMMPGR